MTPRGILLLVALGVVWGIPYLLIRISVGELSPEFIVLARAVLTAAVLLPFAALRRELGGTLRRHWRPILGYAAAEVILPWYFLNTAEQRLPSSTTGLLMSAIPLAGVVVGYLMGRKDQLTWRNWLGILLGMAGVGALVGFDVAGSDLGSALMLLVPVFGYALGPAILARWMPDAPVLGQSAWTFVIVSLVYLPFVGITGGWPTEPPSWQVVVAMLVLGVVCSAVGFVLLPMLVNEVGPMRSTAIAYVNPAVAVAAGALILHEPITVWTVLGFALVLLGSYLVSHRVGRAAGTP